MIISTLKDGLGNQLFQYAAARSLQEKCNEKVYINMLTFMKSGHRQYSLNHFKLNNNVKEMGKFSSLFIGGFFREKIIFLSKYAKIKGMNRTQTAVFSAQRNVVNSDGTFGFVDFNKYTHKGIKYLNGYFQNAKYFDDIRDILVDELSVKTPVNGKNKAMIEELKSVNSVCVHVRLGDYKSAKWSKCLDICTERYYNEGMRLISKKVSNPVFYIFSNTHKDFCWIKDNYKFDYPVKFVDMGNTDYDDFRLMVNCKHFIISNSTYSWWTQYLSNSDDKVVVAPNKWFNPGKKEKEMFFNDDASGLYLDNWITVNV